MFTGIIESTGTLSSLKTKKSNVYFLIKSEITPFLKIDQSIAHNGVCLTVVAIKNDIYTVVAIQETLNKTNLYNLKPNDEINLERSMTLNDRLDGHIVQGHIDQVATCTQVKKREGDYIYQFNLIEKTNLVVEKGSICINGISLTCFNVTDTSFKVAIIPFTYENTNIKYVKKGDLINIEFDIVGKYIQRMVDFRN